MAERISEPIRSVSLQDSELPALRGAPVAPETKKGRRVALGVVLVLAFLAAAWIASSLWVGIILGATMAFTTQPLFRRLHVRLHERHRSLAAVLVTLASGLVTLVLGTASLYVLGRELVDVVGLIQRKTAENGSVMDLFGPRAQHVLAALHVDHAQIDAQIHDALVQTGQKAAQAAAVVLETTGGAVLTIMVAIITEYYVLVEWPKLAVRLESVLPLDPRHTRALFLELRDVGRSAFVGTVATAIIQGALAGVGYAVAGVPRALTWGFATAVASLLPVVGTLLVWIPMGAWLIAHGELGWGIFVLAWGLVVVSLTTDYVIRPRLVGKRGHAHPLLMLVALLGGIQVMGLAGLIVAPIVMSLFLAALRIYERETSAARTPYVEGH